MNKKDTNRLKLNLNLYQRVYLIRTAEERICGLYPQDEIRTPVHLSIGEEAIAAGVCSGLRPEDQIFGTYRSHGIYLAKTGETDKFFAELFGKTNGLSKGKVGSMHLFAPEYGFLGTSSIVASIIPVAAGAAFANKIHKNKKIIAVFFGDGAVEEGAFWESLNVACLMKLPVLFVCEDNDLAVHTHKSLRQGYRSIVDIVAKFNCNIFKKETTDVELIYKLTNQARKAIMESQKPSFLYLRYYRYKEHVGIYEDFHCGYRSRREFEKWRKKDPVNLQRKKLLKLGARNSDLRKIERKIDRQIDNSIICARNADFPDPRGICRDLYINTIG